MKTLLAIIAVLSFGMGYALTGQGDSGTTTLDTVDPSVTVSQPASGASFFIGYNYSFAWVANDTNFPATPVQISYSSDNGSNYSVLESSYANTGTYAWVAPVPATTVARTRISAVDSFGNSGSGLNPGTFTVAYCPPPSVSNVTASQRTDGSKTVDIYFDLADVNNDPCSITVQVSENNGSSYDFVPDADYLSGDLANVAPGTGKHIVWVAGNESRTFDANTFRIRVVANDGTNPPQP